MNNATLSLGDREQLTQPGAWLHDLTERTADACDDAQWQLHIISEVIIRIAERMPQPVICLLYQPLESCGQ